MKKIHKKLKRVTKKFVEQSNYEGIEFPAAVNQYNNTEKQNININVFGYEVNQFHPIYVSKESNQDMLNLTFNNTR